MGTKAIEELEALAGNGDVGAICELGKMYFEGIGGVSVDYAKAKGYFEIAAESGSQFSNYYLGKMFYNGNGVATNYLKAKEYFEKASNADNAFAKYYLGKLYFWGDGVEKNYDKANEYKETILNKPLYANHKVSGIEEFYSMTDFERATKDYVGKLQNEVLINYKNLFGKEQ